MSEKTKALIFDAGPLINLSMNGLLYVLQKLKEKSDAIFLITYEVKREVYDRPINIPQFELGALRINELINKGTLQLPENAGISREIIENKTIEYMSEANKMLRVEGQNVNLVSDAEMSCLALARELEKKNYETLIAIDERTARMICEKPENLVQLMSERMHKKVSLFKSSDYFKGFKFIRSSEIVYVAYKKGIIDLKDKKALEALILATKFKGTSISWGEIDALKKM